MILKAVEELSMATGFEKAEVTTTFDGWRRSGRVVPVGATEDRKKKQQEPRYGYLNFEDPSDQTLIDLADAYLALEENGIDIKKVMKADDEEEGSFDPKALKMMAQLFSDQNAKHKIHSVILACFPDIRRLHDEALALHRQADLSPESFVSPLEGFKPFRKLSLLGAAGEQMNG